MVRDVPSITRSIGTTTSLEVGTVTKTDTPPVMVEFFPFSSMEILKVWGKVLLNVAIPFVMFGALVVIQGIIFGFIDYCASDEPFMWSFAAVVVNSLTLVVSFVITLGCLIYTVDQMQVKD